MNCQEKQVLLPELIEITKEYLKNEIKISVDLNTCHHMINSNVCDITLTFENACFEYTHIIYHVDLHPLRYEKFNDLLTKDVVITFRQGIGYDLNENAWIGSDGKFIIFEMENTDFAGCQTFTILKETALPAIKKLMQLIKNTYIEPEFGSIDDFEW